MGSTMDIETLFFAHNDYPLSLTLTQGEQDKHLDTMSTCSNVSDRHADSRLASLESLNA